MPRRMAGDPRKRPAYQWYVGDANGDEIFRLMTYEQQGVYRALLDHEWIEGSLPADVTLIAALVPKIALDRFKEIWPLISSKFRARDDGRLINDRMEFQRRELMKFVRLQTAKSRKGVLARKLQAKKSRPAGQPALDVGLTSSTSTSTTRSPLPPLDPGPHRKHAACGKVCLHTTQFEAFCQRVAHLSDPGTYVRTWARGVLTRYQEGDRKDAIIGEDMFDFWRDRWAESHPKLDLNTNPAPRRLPTVDELRAQHTNTSPKPHLNTSVGPQPRRPS